MKWSPSVCARCPKHSPCSHPRPAKRKGAAAVELALVAPLLALLFVIAIDLSRIFYYQVVINNCARNGAYVGCSLRSYQEVGQVDPYNGAVNAAVAEGALLSPPLQSNQVKVVYGTGSDGNANVQVTVSYTFSSITNFPGLFATFPMQAQASMRMAP